MPLFLNLSPENDDKIGNMKQEKSMKSFLQICFRGWFLFAMTLSLILAPMPRVNIAWASGNSEVGCWKEGDPDSERLYRPNCDMGTIVQKSRMSKYTGHQKSFIAMMEQAVAGMMAVTLVQSLRFKYLHKLQEGALYGNDCPQNKAGAWTLRIAQLGALSYLTGDIIANAKFQKESQKATDVAFGTPTTSEEFKLTKNKQLRTFDTLIEVLEGQKKGLKTKQTLSIISQAAFLASLGLEGVGIVTCNGFCAANLAAQETRLAIFESAMALAATTVGVETSTPPYGTCLTGASALTAIQGALSSSKAAYVSMDQVSSKAKLSKRIADSSFWVGVLLRLKSLFLGLPDTGASEVANNIATQQTDQLNSINEILKMPVEKIDDGAAAGEVGKNASTMTANSSKDTGVMTTSVGLAQTCAASRPVISAVLTSFIDYFYTPVSCCGGPGLNKPLQGQLLASKKALQGIADTLSGTATATGSAKEALEVAIKEAQAKLMKEGLKKGVAKAIEKIDPSQFASQILEQREATTEAQFATGTIQGLGQAIPSQFASGKDIRVQGLLEGLFSSIESREAFKLYAKNNFESMLRRIGMKVQMSQISGKSPEAGLKIISGIEQKINNILFFFDQVIEETPANELAQGKFKKGKSWQTVMNLISDMVFPKAHALGMLGNMAAGMGLQMVQKAVGTKGPWDEILGLGSQYMLLNSVVGKFAKSHGFTSPKGRMYTWGAMNIVNGAVLAIDQKASKSVDDYIKVMKDERERYANAIGIGGVSESEGGGDGDDTTGKLVANTGDSNGRGAVSGEANIKRCATPNGQGFLPAPCPMKITGSAFDPPKISTDYASGLTPSHLSTMKNISNLSKGLASGSMGADDLASMDLDSWQSANNAMRAFNEKLIKKIDAADKERFKDSDVRPASLEQMLNDAKKAFSGGASAPALASLSPSKGSPKSKENSNKDKDAKDKLGFTKTNPYGNGKGSQTESKGNEFDFGLGEEGGVETEKREVAVNEKTLDDFVINHDDINKRKDVSIFKILSNRYLLSYPKVLEEK